MIDSSTALATSSFAAVGAGQAGADHAGQGGGRGGRAELDGAVDVAGEHELGDLLHERRRVQVVGEHQADDALDDDGEGDRQRADVDPHEGAALLDEFLGAVEEVLVGRGRSQHHADAVQDVAHLTAPFRVNPRFRSV
ncbi:MAG: hypothetical protein QM765_14585 [Myxococcales bacterium]